MITESVLNISESFYPSSLLFNFGEKPNVDNEQEILKKREELQQYVTKGIKRIDSGSLDGSHLLGVATQSVSSFETLLRDVLHLYLSFCRIDYNQALRPLVKGKDADRLTLGEVVLGFRTLNDSFAKYAASSSDRSREAHGRQTQ